MFFRPEENAGWVDYDPAPHCLSVGGSNVAKSCMASAIKHQEEENAGCCFSAFWLRSVVLSVLVFIVCLIHSLLEDSILNGFLEL